MAKYNGNATVEVAIGQGSKRVVRTMRARITPKRVITATRTWDTLGKRVSAYRVGMMPMRLLSHQMDGQPTVVLGQPTP